MLEPPGWKVVESPDFLRDCERIGSEASRLDHHRRAFKFFLERRPLEFSHGLTGEDDLRRVCVSTDHLEGAEYVAGIELEPSTQVVQLVWLERRSV
jgi:hypothetical protein